MINWPIEGNDYYINLIEMTPEERLKALEYAETLYDVLLSTSCNMSWDIIHLDWRMMNIRQRISCPLSLIIESPEEFTD